MTIGDEPLAASLEAPATHARIASRARRRILIAPYPGVENSTLPQAGSALGPGKTTGFIVTSAAVLWALIFAAIAFLR
jgi:hypothetical protein